MRFAVRAGNPRPIYTERHRQILRADVVNDLVESALQKGGIDRIIGLYAAEAIAAQSTEAFSSQIPTSKARSG